MLRALRNFRIMAFTTGVVLLAGCIGLIFKYGFDAHLEPGLGYVWVAHGYLYLVYVATVFLLGMKLRWNLLHIALVMAAGTIPTMSFVAEHFVNRDTRKRLAAEFGTASAADLPVEAPAAQTGDDH